MPLPAFCAPCLGAALALTMTRLLSARALKLGLLRCSSEAAGNFIALSVLYMEQAGEGLLTFQVVCALCLVHSVSGS